MAKVLFVINVPVQEKAKLAKIENNSDKEKDSEDKDQKSSKIENTGDGVDVDLKEKQLQKAETWNFSQKSTPVSLEPDPKASKAPDSGSDVSDINCKTGDHAVKITDTGQESSKRISFVDVAGNKTEVDKAISRSSSDSSSKLSTLKKSDEINIKNTSSYKKKERSNKNKPDAQDNRNVEAQNGDMNKIDKIDGNDKTNKRKNSLQNNGKKVSIDEDHDHDTEYVNFFSDNLTLLERVKATLDLLDIPAVKWSHTKDNVYVGMFIAGDGVRCEEILDKLTYLDIGVVPGSSISVFPASISVASVAREDQAEKMNLELEKEDKLAEKVSEFKKSIKSRLVVAQVVDSVKSDAIFTFDYLMLLILASLVAIMGLLEASSVTLVASMLISPLMGPIIAFVFGAVIRNRELLKVGITSETKGLTLCILVGFISGFIPAFLESAGRPWRSSDSWPTAEMSSRGSVRSLPVGVLIALPSGAGVALSILGGKVGSLVGVAISASLLPPAVNAGLLWANAIVVGISPPHAIGNYKDALQNSSVSTTAETLYESDLRCPDLLDNHHTHIYSCNMAVENVVLGVISLLLTLVNIVCIIVMGIAVLKIKEVAPIRSAPGAEKDFFAKDLKVARESYETTKGPNSAILGKKFLQEYKKFKQEIGVEDSKNTDTELNEILEDVEGGEDVKEILDKLPHRPKRWNQVSSSSSYVENSEAMAGNPYHTFHGATFKPSSPETAFGIRKRGSAYLSFSPSRVDDDERHNSVYFTTTHRFVPAMDAYHSPRISHRSPGRFFSKKPKGRFHVAKVEEDGHDVPKGLAASSSPSKVEIMPAITEREYVPLLDTSSKEI